MTDREKVESALINAGIFKYCTVKELTEIACSLIANGVTVNEWRPASEPPKECGEYNVMIFRAETPTTLFYSKVHNGWYVFNDDEYDIPYNVTHWMPRPEAPKGDKE